MRTRKGKGKVSLSIRRQMLIFLILLIIVPLFAISLISYAISRQAIQSKSMMYNADILSEISNSIEQLLGAIDSMSIMFCYNDNVQSYIKQINEIHSEYHSMLLSRQLARELFNSTVASSSVESPTLITYRNETLSNNMMRVTETSLKYRPEDIVALQKARGALVWITIDGEQPKILFGREINDLSTQVPIGYFMAYFDAYVLNSMLKDITYFAESDLYLVDRNGYIIAANRPEHIGTLCDYAKYDDEEGSVFVESSGMYIGRCSVILPDWSLISVMPAVQFESEIQQLLKNTLLIAFIAAIAASLIAWVFASRIVNPIRALCNQMNLVGEGDFNVRKPIKQKNEIGMLYHFFYEMVEQIDNLILKNERQELLIKKAELNSLRMQINPHFIYNTLESIKWIANTDKNEDIVIMIKALGDFMRSSISGSEFVTLKTEIENIQCYLIILRYRYGERLRIDIDLPTEMEDILVPKLIIQPIVENAIVHGLEHKMGVGHIRIRVWTEGDGAFIAICDNGIGISEMVMNSIDLDENDLSSVSVGIGLRNVHQRIRMYYGDVYGLKLESNLGVGTTVTIHVPMVANG